MARLITAGASTPPGAVEAFAMATPPRGWLKANGAAVSRVDYPRLFAAIGEQYGAGDGATTFNLPDLRGEFLRGHDDGRGVDPGRAQGSTQGDETRAHNHAASTNSAGSHGHSGSANSAGSHNHSASVGQPDSSSSPARFGAGDYATGTKYTSSAGAHTHSLSINSNGSHSHTVSVNNTGGAETRPRNVAMTYCIKT